MLCKDCVHAEFPKTLKGRIKKKAGGICRRQAEMKQRVEQAAAPCVVVRAHSCLIWIDTVATNCPEWREVETRKEL